MVVVGAYQALPTLLWVDEVLMSFDRERARLIGPDLFPRFSSRVGPVALHERPDLADAEHLLVLERNGERRGFRMKELALHHVAQGELGGEPFCLSFCVVCATAVDLRPVHDGRVLQLSAGGWADAEGLLVDDNTGSYWDPVQGLALTGPLAGLRLPVRPVEWLTVAAARAAEPDLPVHLSEVERWHPRWLFVRYWIPRLTQAVRFPPGFHETVGEIDPRRPLLETGLGVVAEGEARFFPLTAIHGGGREIWLGRTLEIVPGRLGSFPQARWAGGGRPFQLLSRWYGFARRWPGTSLGGFEPSELPRLSAVPAEELEFATSELVSVSV